MEEVALQISPLKGVVEKMEGRLRSLYSNGSGGPPGYLEMARAEDERRYLRLSDEQQRATEQIEKVIGYIELLKDREKQREKRMARYWRVASIAAAPLLGFVIWLVHAALPVVRAVYEDYLKSHPYARQQIEKTSSDYDPTIARDQDAAGGFYTPPND